MDLERSLKDDEFNNSPVSELPEGGNENTPASPQTLTSQGSNWICSGAQC